MAGPEASELVFYLQVRLARSGSPSPKVILTPLGDNGLIRLPQRFLKQNCDGFSSPKPLVLGLCRLYGSGARTRVD
jgi:hypothetical protein